MGNKLTFAHLAIIAMDSCSGFRTITIPMEGVQGNQLSPHSFQQLGGPKDLLQKATLLESNSCAISSYNERWLEYQTIQVIENET